MNSIFEEADRKEEEIIKKKVNLDEIRITDIHILK
jgi:hypothetical protein